MDSRPEPYFEHEVGPSSIWKVIDAADSGDVDAARMALEKFVTSEWLPESLDGLPFDPNHWTFFGLWCWVGALAAVRYEIDDVNLLGSPHWPGDVVAAARAGTVFARTSDRDYEAPMLGAESAS